MVGNAVTPSFHPDAQRVLSATRRTLSLRGRTTLFVLVFTVLVQLLTVGGNLATATLERSADEQRAVENMAANLARSSGHLLAAQDGAGLLRLAQSLVASEPVLFAVVHDTRGAVVALDEAESGAWQAYRQARETYRGTVARAPVFDEAELGLRRCIGSVQVASTRTPFLQAMWRDAGNRLAMVALVAILAIPAARWMVRALTRRLDALVVASERIACGHLDQTIGSAVDDDEVGRLTRSFEQMRQALQARQREMSDFNQTLQSLVAERTRDLEAARDRAEAANRAKGEFLANMSHELRTPLHILLSFADLGISRAGSATPERLTGYFDRIGQAGRRLLGLVNELLDLSELATAGRELRRAPHRVATVLRASMAALAADYATRNLRLELVTAADPEAMVDAERLGQVFREVLDNAARFSAPGGVVTVSLAADAERCRVVVADEGVGIPPDELEAIFTRFTQSSRTRTGAGGTGVGLATCRQILQLHDGRITAHNRQPRGAEFVIEFPLGAAPTPAPVAAAEVTS